MLFPRKCGKTDQVILKILKSMTPEQYALVNKMVKEALESRILNGSPEMRRLETLTQVRANLKNIHNSREN